MYIYWVGWFTKFDLFLFFCQTKKKKLLKRYFFIYINIVRLHYFLIPSRVANIQNGQNDKNQYLSNYKIFELIYFILFLYFKIEKY